MGQARGTTFTGSATARPSVPLRSDMWDGSGMSTLGKLTRVWFLFFQSLGTVNKFTQSWTAQTTVTVTHGLNTTDVGWWVYDSTGLATTPATVTVTSSSVLTLTFGSPFTGRVVVMA